MYLPGIEEAVERMKKERRGSQPRIKEEYIEDSFLKNPHFTGLIGLIYSCCFTLLFASYTLSHSLDNELFFLNSHISP